MRRQIAVEDIGDLDQDHAERELRFTFWSRIMGGADARGRFVIGRDRVVYLVDVDRFVGACARANSEEEQSKDDEPQPGMAESFSAPPGDEDGTAHAGRARRSEIVNHWASLRRRNRRAIRDATGTTPSGEPAGAGSASLCSASVLAIR